MCMAKSHLAKFITWKIYLQNITMTYLSSHFILFAEYYHDTFVLTVLTVSKNCPVTKKEKELDILCKDLKLLLTENNAWMFLLLGVSFIIIFIFGSPNLVWNCPSESTRAHFRLELNTWYLEQHFEVIFTPTLKNTLNCHWLLS